MMRLATPSVQLTGRPTAPPPRFELRQCPVCVGTVTGPRRAACGVCGGVGFVLAPAGLYARIVARQIMRGAIP